MNSKPISEARDSDLRLSMVALQRAAQRARELAMQTNTRLVVSRKGADGQAASMTDQPPDPRHTDG